MSRMSDMRQAMTRRIVQSRMAIESLEASQQELLTVASSIGATLEAGGTLFTCGNGGSAAQALHLAEELVGRFRSNRAPLRAICLNADPTALTCIANDFGFDEVFARQLRGVAQAGDCLMVLSTSGRSPNLLRALEAAREIGVHCLGLLGGEGGPALPLCHAAISLHGCDSAAVQEAHLMAIHIICETLEPSEVAASVARPGR